MTRISNRLLSATLMVMAGVACSEATTSPTSQVSTLADAFTTAPLAYSSVNSSVQRMVLRRGRK